jgi:spore germination protein YaaH
MVEDERRMAVGENRLHAVPDPQPEDEFVDPGPDESDADGLPPHRRGLRPLVALLLAIAVLTGGAAATHRWPFGGADSDLRLTAALPYWSIAADSAKILAHRDDFSSVTPWMYGIDDQAGVVSMLPTNSTARIDEALIELEQEKVPLTPTICNMRDGSWDYPTIIATLRNPVLRRQHIAKIVNLVKLKNYAGIDIDYENFEAGDRDVFTAFITELATALHHAHKTLSVDVFAKTSDRGYDQRNRAQDYHALGRAADTVRIMAYDWHWNSSAPGPIAPINWVRSVLDYALTQIPAHKIVLGVPAYGYNWVGKKGTLVSWLQAYGLAQKYSVPVHWDATSQSPWLKYRTHDGTQHVVWFENSYSAMAKLALARGMHIHGAYIWLAGDEDDLLWKSLSPGNIDKAAKSASTQENEGPAS